MDRHSPPELQEDTPTSLKTALKLFDRWDEGDHGRLRYVFSPRFAGCCSPELMQSVGKVAAERNAFIQSHLSENIDEVRWIRSLFPDQPSYTDIYASAGLLGKRTIMGHCIHLSNEEIQLLAGTQTKVSFCPYSNRTLRSG